MAMQNNKAGDIFAGARTIHPQHDVGDQILVKHGRYDSIYQATIMQVKDIRIGIYRYEIRWGWNCGKKDAQYSNEWISEDNIWKPTGSGGCCCCTTTDRYRPRDSNMEGTDKNDIS
eukprot:14908054-Ditylum_brightwellii.AAC.1